MKTNKETIPTQLRESQTDESGRTMLEMLGVISIIGIITYGAIAGINYGMTTYKINQTFNDVQDIVQGVQDLYSWSPRYPGNADIINAIDANDIFPEGTKDCTGGGRCLRGQFGDIRVDSPDGKNFQVTLTVLDSDIRTRLMALSWETVNIRCEVLEGSSTIRCTPE